MAACPRWETSSPVGAVPARPGWCRRPPGTPRPRAFGQSGQLGQIGGGEGAGDLQGLGQGGGAVFQQRPDHAVGAEAGGGDQRRPRSGSAPKSSRRSAVARVAERRRPHQGVQPSHSGRSGSAPASRRARQRLLVVPGRRPRRAAGPRPRRGRPGSGRPRAPAAASPSRRCLSGPPGRAGGCPGRG